MIEVTLMGSRGAALRTLIDDADWPALSGLRFAAHHGSRGKYSKKTYAIVCVGGRYVFLHRFLMQPTAGSVVDHIDGDSLNNQRTNLRVCTHQENMRNRGPNANNPIGQKNIRWEDCSWRVSFRARDKTIFSKRFRSLDDAIAARDAKLAELHGEFARR